jgi:hypothetical protein
MRIEFWFFVAAAVITIVIGAVMVPILRKAMKDDKQS